MEKLRENVHLGIIANQGKGLRERLESHSIADYFELIVSSAEVGMKKPSPDIFIHVLQRANVAAKSCVYIGDRCDNDIIPLKKLGFMTVRIMQGLGQYQPEHPIFHSDHTVQNLSELVELFSKKG